MESKSPANKKIHGLFKTPGNRENFSLFYKLLSQPSRGFCLCQVPPGERLKILEFFDGDPLIERVYIIDMVKPLRGPMELQQTIMDVDKKFGSGKDIFFIYNIEECINLLKKSAEKFFQEMNLIRDFFMHFDAVFVFFLTESSVKVMIKNAFDFYDWMKFTFIFVSESKDTGIGEKEERKYSAALDKIAYLKNSLEKVKNEKAKSMRLLELGQLYFQLKDYNEALESFNKSLEIAEKTNDKAGMERVHADIDEINRLTGSQRRASGTVKRSGAIAGEEFNWDELLRRIRGKNVIPVIGHGLYWVEIEPGGKTTRLLYDYLAEQVAAECGFAINPGENHKFARACAEFIKKPDKDYYVLANFLKEKMQGVSLIPADSLRKLARIKAFNVYITTAYDDFLAKTIKAVRSNPTRVLGYTITEKNLNILNSDLFDSIRYSQSTLVYRIFGSMKDNAAPAYSERDILETLLGFNKDMGVHRENYLFQELRVSSLLFIGCGYDDWLYRLFIRIMANEPYEFPGRNPLSRKFIADDFRNYKEDSSRELHRFLRDYDTDIFHTGTANDFVDLLFDKLETAYPEEIIQPVDFPGTAAQQPDLKFLKL